MLKEIPQYPGFFASDTGEIYSKRSGNLHLLNKRIHKGYYRVNVRDNNHPCIDHVENVHKLVLNAFVGERPEGYVCRHLNGNALDNHIENLCWGTPKENVADSVRHGTAAFLHFEGENHPRAKLSQIDVDAIRYLQARGKKRKDIAKFFDVDPSTIGAVMRGINWNTPS